MNIDDLKTQQEVDQALADSIALGNIRIIGRDDKGQDLMTLTSKGSLRVSLLAVQTLVNSTDEAKRDFTSSEKHEISRYLIRAIQALQ